MRSKRDRIRHTLSFEILGLAIITPLGSLAFGLHAEDMGLVGLVSATVATAWNYLYNLGFDHVMQRRLGTTLKTPGLRVIHAILFELGLIIALTPFIALFLGITLWEALMMDISIAVFYVVYAYLFNWAYDRLFPLPEWQKQAEVDAT